MQGAGGVGGLLAVNTSSATYFPAFDGGGNITGLVNAADGSLAAEYEYDPFGSIIKAVGAAANVCPFGFSTKYTDTETGLVRYEPNRYYNSIPGQFLSRDPIDEYGGLNLYAFVGNNPINRVDPLGLKFFGVSPSFFQDVDTADIGGNLGLTSAQMFQSGRCIKSGHDYIIDQTEFDVLINYVAIAITRKGATLPSSTVATTRRHEQKHLDHDQAWYDAHQNDLSGTYGNQCDCDNALKEKMQQRHKSWDDFQASDNLHQAKNGMD
jgi:RHS repeat-associated protein